MKYLAIAVTVLALAGCKERLEEGAEIDKKRAERKEGKVNVNGKLVDAPPVGVSEVMVLVDGKWHPAKNVEVRCVNGQCKPVVVRR